MKTRRSNRTKKPIIDDVPLDDTPEALSDDAYQPPADSNEAAGDDDSPFEEPTAMEVDEPDDLEASGLDEEAPTPSRRKSKQRVHKITNAKDAGYMDISTARGTQFSVLGYIGPYDRGTKGKPLLRVWYGPNAEDIDQARRMLVWWSDFTVLPPKVLVKDADDPISRVWAPGRYAKEKELAEAWYNRMKSAQGGDQFISLPSEESQLYASTLGALPVVIGPRDAQIHRSFSPGDHIPITENALPVDVDKSQSRKNAGWLFDVGGLVLDLDWAPEDEDTNTQRLALAVIPHADQQMYNYEKESSNPGFQRYGTVQIWTFEGADGLNGYLNAAKTPATHLKTLCLDRGRVKRISWSPTRGLLAILCGDGSVCVVEPGTTGSGEFEKVQDPIVTLGLDESDTRATAMTWVNCNRLAVGYSDGSIALWSIFPRQLLSRLPVHHNDVVEMASAYPTFPYLVSSCPIGGTSKLIDLRAPSYDTTEATAATVNTQPGTMAWSDHLLGFFSLLPTSKTLGNVVGFAHYGYYPVVRRVTTPDSFVTAVSAGREHPFLLVGTVDGSLWALNPQVELFGARGHVSDRIRVFNHEHRSAALFPEGSPAASRGASRIIHGFKKEKNPNPRTEVKAPAPKSSAKKPAKGKAAANSQVNVGDATKVIHEPLTRITAVKWNPNKGFGCWAAISMASGLVRVMDLGLAYVEEDEEEGDEAA